MSVKETLFSIIVAALTVIGFYGVLHGLLEILLTPRELATAVLLEQEVTPEELDVLLCEARRTPFGGGRRVVLVLPSSLGQGSMRKVESLPEGYAEILEKYGAALSIGYVDADE